MIPKRMKSHAPKNLAVASSMAAVDLPITVEARPSGLVGLTSAEAAESERLSGRRRWLLPQPEPIRTCHKQTR